MNELEPEGLWGLTAVCCCLRRSAIEVRIVILRLKLINFVATENEHGIDRCKGLVRTALFKTIE
jgi:hypothetical protein